METAIFYNLKAFLTVFLPDGFDEILIEELRVLDLLQRDRVAQKQNDAGRGK